MSNQYYVLLLKNKMNQFKTINHFLINKSVFNKKDFENNFWNLFIEKNINIYENKTIINSINDFKKEDFKFVCSKLKKF